jgi:hypothetical protein
MMLLSVVGFWHCTHTVYWAVKSYKGQTLAYYEHSQITDTKSFITLAPDPPHDKNHTMIVRNSELDF